MEFTNYFMFSEMQKPLFKKGVKLMEKSSYKNNVYVMLINKLIQKGLKSYQIFNIMEMIVE